MAEQLVRAVDQMNVQMALLSTVRLKADATYRPRALPLIRVTVTITE